MTKLHNFSKNKTRALLAILVAVCVVVPSILVAAFHVKAEDSRVSKDVEEVVTTKTAEPNGDGTYHVKIEAYNTAYSIHQIPTDTVLVLERSSKMSDVLYTRDKTNLLTYTVFSGDDLESNNSMFDIDNPDNIYLKIFGQEIKFSINNKYQNNKYIKDPNNPEVYVYFCQTYQTTRDGLMNYNNHYKYSIVDTQGNIYESDTIDQSLVSTSLDALLGSLSSSLSSVTMKWKGNINYPGVSNYNTYVAQTGLSNTKQAFVVSTVYTRDDDNATNATLWNQYKNHGGLWIEDDYGELCPVTITRYGRDGNVLPDSASDADAAYYVYSVTDSNGKEFSATYGNPVYGGQYSVFQGFKSYDSSGAVDHEGSIEHKTLYNGESQDVTKLLAMQEAAEDFILKVHKNAYDNELVNGEQKIGVVSYASRTEAVWNNNRLSKTEYPLTDVYSESNAYKMIKTIYAMEADGRRRIDVGMEYAKEMLDNRVYSGSKNNLDTSVNPGSAADHNVNVIAFTTGMPSTKIGGDYDTDVANTAIDASRYIESHYPNAKIYTIGMYDGADATELYGDWFYRMSHANVPCDGSVGSYWGGTYLSGVTNSDMLPRDAAATNRFLNYLSSNFKNSASSIGLSGPKFIRPSFWSTGGTGYEITENYDRVSSDYYYAATEWETVENAFDTIAESVQVSMSILQEGTKLKDSVSDYFNFSGNVTSYTMDYDGSGEYGDSHWSNPTSIDNTVDGKDITVTNFDYANNYCASGHQGKKVVLEFDAEPIDGFLGGHGVPTNKGSSAIYDEKDQLVESLPYPLVDVDLDIDLTTNDQFIYYSKETDLADLFTVSNYAQGLTNDYVDVLYNVIDPDTNEVVLSYYVPAGEDEGNYSLTGEAKGDQYPVLENNKTYTIQCVLTTIDEDVSDRESYTESDSATVYVYKPTLTVKDSTEQYEDAVAGVDLRENMVSVTWSAEGTDEPAPSEGAPTVSYEFYEGTDESKTRVNDYTNHSMSETTDYDVDLVINGHNFSYDTVLPYYVLADDSEVLISEYDANTHAARVPVTITYEDEDGNTVTENLVEYDEEGNEIPVYQTVNKVTTIHDNKPDLRDADKHFATYENQTDNTKTDGHFTVYTGTPFDFLISKKFAGDYANPEAVTFTISGSDGSSQTVTINRNDFTGQQSSNIQTGSQLKTGVTYTVIEGFVDTETDEAKYDTTFSGKWIDGEDVETVVSDADNDEANEVFVFTIPSANEPTAVYLAVTNTDTSEPPVVTGQAENKTKAPYLLLATLALVGTGSGIWLFERKESIIG